MTRARPRQRSDLRVARARRVQWTAACAHAILKELGRYLVSDQIGTGRMGRVYRGVNPSGRSVAIKVVHPHRLS